MRDGRLEQLGTPEACFAEPASRFVARFLGEAVFLPGRIAGGMVHTALGNHPLAPGTSARGEVQMLLRPDDVDLTAARDGNGTIEWMRYEGEMRLYGVRLRTGSLLKVRVNHEVHLERGDPVMAWICASQPLSLFSAGGADTERAVAETAPAPSEERPIHAVRA